MLLLDACSGSTSASETAEESPDGARVLLVLASIGFALCISPLVSLTAAPARLGGVGGLLGGVIFFGAAAFTCLLAAGMDWGDGRSSHPSARRGSFACLAFALVGCAAGFFGHVADGVVAAFLVTLGFAFFGVGLAVALMLWGAAWSKLDACQSDEKLVSLAIVAGCVIAGLVSTLVSFAPTLAQAVIPGGCLAASLIARSFCVDGMPSVEPSGEDTRVQLKFFLPNMLQPLSVGFGAGVVASGVLPGGLFGPPFMLEGCLLAASLVVFLVVLARPTVPRFSGVQRLVCTVIAVLMTVVLYLGEMSRAVDACVLIAFQCAYFVFHYNALVLLSYHHRVTTPLHFFQGLIAPFAGVFLGVVTGEAFVLASSVFGEGLAAIPCLAAVVVFLVSQAIAPFTLNAQADLAFCNEDGAGEGACASSHENSERIWRKALDAVCEEFLLTPREAEVLALLSRGRNAEHIGRQLFIATSTVKTHSQRIYRKLSINSQQELIDIVEARTSPE